jgi:hypothetical protein
MSKIELSQEQCKEILNTLKARFEKNMKRHKGVEWANVQQSWTPKRKEKNCGH